MYLTVVLYNIVFGEVLLYYNIIDISQLVQLIINLVLQISM